PRASATPSPFGAGALSAESFKTRPQTDFGEGAAGPTHLVVGGLPDYDSASLDIGSAPHDAGTATIDQADSAAHEFDTRGDHLAMSATAMDNTMADNHLGDATAANTLEDELDEADFYVAQGMFSAAVDLLRGVLERHPNHPLVIAKLRDASA